MDQILLNLQQMCEYTGLKKSVLIKIANNPDNRFIVRLDTKIFFHKRLFDEYIKKCVKERLGVE